MLVGTNTTSHENGRFMRLLYFGGSRGVSCLVVAVTREFPTPPGTGDDVGASPPSVGVGMTKCATEGWQFYFQSNDHEASVPAPISWQGLEGVMWWRIWLAKYGARCRRS